MWSEFYFVLFIYSVVVVVVALVAMLGDPNDDTMCSLQW